MKIAIISDVHNNLANLKKVLDYCQKEGIGKIICCGDLASMETLDFLNDNFSGEIYYCFGNMDDGQLKNYNFGEKYKNTWIFKNFGETILRSSASKSYKIAFVHYPEIAYELCETGKYNYVFCGHTHKPWEETRELPAFAEAPARRCKILNPGNVTGEIYQPTFAVWDTENDKFELIRIHELK